MAASGDSAFDDAGETVYLLLHGQAASIFAEQMLTMYRRYAERAGFAFQQLSVTTVDNGFYRNVICAVTGASPLEQFQFETGAHAARRTPPQTYAPGQVRTYQKNGERPVDVVVAADLAALTSGVAASAELDLSQLQGEYSVIRVYDFLSSTVSDSRINSRASASPTNNAYDLRAVLAGGLEPLIQHLQSSEELRGLSD